MIRFTMTVALAGALLAGVGGAVAQTAPTGTFGQRTSGGAYVPSTNDPGCEGVLCNPLPSVVPGGSAGRPSEVAAPPPCQGLLCSATPYSMQRPYTAAEAAEIERQRAAALAQQAAAAPPPEAAPVRHMRKRRKVAKVAKAAPVKAAAAAKAAPAKAAPAPAEARTPAPASADDVQSLR